MVLKALAVWVGILVLAIMNGTLREVIFIPAFGYEVGLFISGIILSVLIFGVTYIMLPWLGRLSLKIYLLIGVSWLCLTLIIEFSLGYFVQDKPLSMLFEGYTFKDGNLWTVVLFITAVSPFISAKIKGWV